MFRLQNGRADRTWRAYDVPLATCVLVVFHSGRGGGDVVWGQFRGGIFHEGKFSTHLQFGCRAIRHGNFDTPNPWFVNQLCETLAGPNFEQHLIKDRKQEQGPGWLSILKEAPARDEDRVTTATKDAQSRARSAPNCATFPGANFDPKLETKAVPTNLSPDEVFSPCTTALDSGLVWGSWMQRRPLVGSTNHSALGQARR